MIDQLIISKKYPPSEVSTKIKKDLEDLDVSEDLIQRLCREKGCTRESQTINLETIDQGNGQVLIQMKGENGEILDSWKPGERPASKNILTQDSSTGKEPKPTCSKCGKEGVKDENDHCCTCGFTENKPIHHDANADYIHHLVKLINFWKAVKMKVGLIPFKEKIDPADYEEWMRVSDGALDFADQAWDERNIVPVPYQFKLAEFVNQSTIKNGAKMFLGWIKEMPKISSKQVTKILLGKVRDVDAYYEPVDELSAKESKFFGEPCQKCSSFRVKWEHGWAHCFACEAEYPVKPRPLGKFKDEDEGEGEE